MSMLRQTLLIGAVATMTALMPGAASAQADSAKYAPDVPAKITTPDTVETRIGT